MEKILRTDLSENGGINDYSPKVCYYDVDPQLAIVNKSSSWIQSSLNFELPANIMEENYNNVKTDSYLYTEMSQIDSLIQQLGRNLQNVYDNYMCFFGEADEAQLEKLRANVYKNIVEYYQGESCNNFAMVLLHQAFVRFCILQDCDNENIIDSERSLAKEVSNRIVELFKNRLLSYMSQQNMSLEKLKYMKFRMIKYCSAMFVECLNDSGKMNHVESCFAKRTNKQMEHIYERCVESLFEPEIENDEMGIENCQILDNTVEATTTTNICTRDESYIAEHQVKPNPLFVLFLVDTASVKIRVMKRTTKKKLKQVKTYQVKIIRDGDVDRACFLVRLFRKYVYLESNEAESFANVLVLVYDSIFNKMKNYQVQQKECILLTDGECTEWKSAFQIFMQNFSEEGECSMQNRHMFLEMLPEAASWIKRFRPCIVSLQRELELQHTGTNNKVSCIDHNNPC